MTNALRIVIYQVYVNLNRNYLQIYSNKHKINDDFISEFHSTILKSANSNLNIIDDDKTISDYSDNMEFTLNDANQCLDRYIQ